VRVEEKRNLKERQADKTWIEKKFTGMKYNRQRQTG
jgi:hypothetical protein